MENQYLDNLADHAKTLLEQLERGDSNEALKTIDAINKARDFGLYQEIGKLTRSLHDAITNFHIDTNAIGTVQAAEPETTDENGEVSAMEDASDRLSYVIQLTENAANKTMDMVEDTIPISQELGDSASHLKEEWTKLLKRELGADEFRTLYKDIDVFLDFTSQKTGEIGGNLSNILMAQDYQDLTGQVIKKVIHLVTEVEDKLVELVRMASHVENITGIDPEEVQLEKIEQDVEQVANPHQGDGPVINPEERDDVVASQDEVDDLLSSLGF